MKKWGFIAVALIIVSCQKDSSGYTLETSTNPFDGGTINATEKIYSEGEIVILTAVASEGYEFSNWSGDAQGTNPTVEILMDGDKNVIANFDQIVSSLPVVRISTNGMPIESKEEYIPATVRISGGGSFPELEETEIEIRGRGNSTWWQGEVWGKKPYQIKFENKQAILGMPEDRRWVLLAEISDKSLIRNKISRELSFMTDLSYTPAIEYVELFLNNEHQGTYLMGQKVEESSNRVNIGDDGYLIEIDQTSRIDPDDVYFTPQYFTADHSSTLFNIKNPNVELNSDQYNLIKNHVDYFESVLFSDEFANPTTGYAALIDVDSFIDWFLVTEIGKSVDAMWHSSIFFSYIPGEKITMGPIWDYDLSFGNVDYADSQYAEGFWVRYNPWINRLFDDPAFAQKVKTRYALFYNNKSEILSKVDSYASYINISQTYNYNIWETLGTYVWPNPVWYDSYPEEVNHLKNWIDTRMEWLNDNL